MLININEMGIDYRDHGSGEPVVFIHAFPLNQTMWDHQLSRLQNSFRVITTDLRGFGRSDAPDGPYSMTQMADDVRALLYHLDIHRMTLVGLSMGGYISLALLRKYPKVVRALVLADTRATADTPEARERRLISADKAEREGVRAIADDMVPLLLGRTSLDTRPDVVRRVREMIEGNSPQGIAAAQRGMSERIDSTTLLAELELPCQVIVGSEDVLTPLSEAETLHRGIKGARFNVIDRAGHLSNLEQPEEFNRVLSDFIGSLDHDK
jgi:3-oxoadipate enol-lactonase